MLNNLANRTAKIIINWLLQFLFVVEATYTRFKTANLEFYVV